MPLITGKKSSPRYASMNISRALTHIFAGADFEAGASNGASAPYNQCVRCCGIAAAEVAPFIRRPSPGPPHRLPAPAALGPRVKKISASSPWSIKRLTSTKAKNGTRATAIMIATMIPPTMPAPPGVWMLSATALPW